jgi:hypothetical protein
MSGLRVYASAQNPWFWSKYDSYDPEVGDPDNTDVGQVSSSVVPSSRLFLVGVNLQF